MTLVISVVLAFLLSGVAQVIADLGNPNFVERPLWVSHPTFGMAVWCALNWFTRMFDKPIYAYIRRTRAFALGMLDLIVHMGVATACIWLCITLADHLFSNMVLQIVSAAVFVIVGSVFLWTYISLIKLLLTFILMFPLELMFPAIAHDAQYWCNKGFTFSDHGKHQKAVRCFDKALKVDSNRFLTWCNTGTSEYNLDRRTAAMRCYQRVLASVAAQAQSDPRVIDLIGRCRERLQELEHK